MPSTNQNAFYLNTENEWFVTAEEIRQYFYCPRIPFLRTVRQFHPWTTYLMQKGTKFHEYVLKVKSPHRQLMACINPPNAKIEQYFDIYFESPQYHLSGLLDMFEKDGEDLYPVEIKTGEQPAKGKGLHHEVQLTTQAILLEENFHTAVTKARIIYIGSRKSEWVNITLKMKMKVMEATNEIMASYQSEIIPNPTPHEAKCVDCEYWSKCLRI